MARSLRICSLLEVQFLAARVMFMSKRGLGSQRHLPDSASRARRDLPHLPPVSATPSSDAATIRVALWSGTGKPTASRGLS